MKKILETVKKINKNNVSYFEAGYIAGALKAGMTAERVIDLHYTTITFHNEMLKYLLAYDKEKYHEQGLRKMFKVKIK